MRLCMGQVRCFRAQRLSRRWLLCAVIVGALLCGAIATISLAQTPDEPIVLPAPGTDMGQETLTEPAERFSVTVEQLELGEILMLLAEEWALTLQFDPVPEAVVSLTVVEATLPEVLAQLLHGLGLDFRLEGDILRVAEPETLMQEDAARRQRQEALLPLKTVYLQVNYADAEVLAAMISGADEGGLLSSRGVLQVDARTNTLIVRDIEASVADIQHLLRSLDVPVSQVLIEARIVSASLDTGRELGVRWGMAPISEGETAGAARYTLEAGHRQATQAGMAVLRNSHLLEWELSALEHQGEAELIARPRIITQDNTPASIRSGVRIPYQAQAGGTAGGSITQFVDAVLALDVTPLITPDQRIIMQLGLRQDSVAPGSGDVPAINTNTIETRVLIEDNDTLVLGGIFREEQVRSETGTPVLRRIPALGRLFRRETFSSQRTELLVFITPRIIASVADE